jgi:hypothetical protein
MKQLKTIAFVLSAFILGACNKDNDQTGIGDVMIVAKKSGGETVYGLSFYAYTFGTFESVKAFSAADPDKIYTLKPNQGLKTNFYYEMTDAEFKTTKPTASTYTFQFAFLNGTAHESQDVLLEKALDPPTFEKCQYNETAHQLEVTWAALTNADSYAINILDGQNVVFASPELANTGRSFFIKTTGGGWAAGFTPTSGKTYKVKLLAFHYESQQNNAYNVQATSVSETTATWGD